MCKERESMHTYVCMHHVHACVHKFTPACPGMHVAYSVSCEACCPGVQGSALSCMCIFMTHAIAMHHAGRRCESCRHDCLACLQCPSCIWQLQHCVSIHALMCTLHGRTGRTDSCNSLATGVCKQRMTY